MGRSWTMNERNENKPNALISSCTQKKTSLCNVRKTEGIVNVAKFERNYYILDGVECFGWTHPDSYGYDWQRYKIDFNLI